jgi:hypothetical protein
MAFFDPGFQKSTHAMSKVMNLNLTGKKKTIKYPKKNYSPIKI